MFTGHDLHFNVQSQNPETCQYEISKSKKRPPDTLKKHEKNTRQKIFNEGS